MKIQPFLYACAMCLIFVACSESGLVSPIADLHQNQPEELSALSVYVSVESEVVKEGGCCENGQCVNPVIAAEVQLIPNTPGSASIRVQTGSDGFASFPELDHGQYTLDIASEYGTELRNITLKKTVKRHVVVLFKE